MATVETHVPVRCSHLVALGAKLPVFKYFDFHRNVLLHKKKSYFAVRTRLSVFDVSRIIFVQCFDKDSAEMKLLVYF